MREMDGREGGRKERTGGDGKKGGNCAPPANSFSPWSIYRLNTGSVRVDSKYVQCRGRVHLLRTAHFLVSIFIMQLLC